MMDRLFINLYFIVNEMMIKLHAVIVEIMSQKYNKRCLNQT